MRQKRNRLMYEGVVVVGRAEAETAIAEVEKFRTAVVKIIAALKPPTNP